MRVKCGPWKMVNSSLDLFVYMIFIVSSLNIFANFRNEAETIIDYAYNQNKYHYSHKQINNLQCE